MRGPSYKGIYLLLDLIFLAIELKYVKLTFNYPQDIDAHSQ
jgi:hypothetical protein